MKNDTFDLLGTKPKSSAEFSVLSVIKDTKDLIDLAFEIREAKTFIGQKEQRLKNELERMTILADKNAGTEPPDDDDFYSLIPEDFTKIEPLYALVGIYESAQRNHARMGLLSSNQKGEKTWLAWAKSMLGDEISLTFITYLESRNKWSRIRIDLPAQSVAVFTPGLLRISLPDFNQPGKDWWFSVEDFASGGKIINFHRTISNIVQRTNISHPAMRLTSKEGFDYIPDKDRYHPALELVFDLQLPDKERVQAVLDAMIADPFKAFGVDPNLLVN
jgi:hypothetical protein